MKYLLALILVISGNGFTSETMLSTFDSYAEAQRQAWQVPGMAIGIVKDGKVIFAKGYGQRGLTDKQAVDPDTVFQIGSLSKAFTSALVAIGTEKEWFKWENKVIQHDPLFRLSDSWVTTEFEIQDLLAQRSGLPAYAGDLQAFFGFSREEILSHLSHLAPVSGFRANYAYQNIFFVVAAKILQTHSQQSYERFLKNELFDPLKMNHSSSTVEEYLANENRAEWLMRIKDGSTVRLSDDFPYRSWNYILGPAGGINSSLNDMLQWLILQTEQGKYDGKQLISAENMKRMRRPMVFAAEAMQREMYYALGWVRMENSPYPIIWHDGSTLGVYNVLAFIPEEKIGIVILTNVRNTKLALGLTLQFFDMYFDKPNQDWSQQLLVKANEPEVKKNTDEEVYPPMPLSAYVGTYTNPIYGNVEIEIDQGKLSLIFKKGGFKFTLDHLNRDSFAFRWPPIEEGPLTVFFEADEHAKIASMQIDAFTKEGSGQFVKLIP